MGRQKSRAEAALRARKAITQNRDSIETILNRAEHLAPADRSLIRGVYDRGMSAADLARAVDQNPEQLRNRINRLLKRINAPAFRYVIRNRRYWKPDRREIAEAVFRQIYT